MRCSAFSRPGRGGFADFDAIEVREPNPRGLTRPIPYGRDDRAGDAWAVRNALDRRTPAMRCGRRRGAGHAVHGGRPRAGTRGAALGARPRLGRARRTAVARARHAGRCRDVPVDRDVHRRADPAVACDASLCPAGRRRPARSAPTAAGPHPNGRDGVRWVWQPRPRNLPAFRRAPPRSVTLVVPAQAGPRPRRRSIRTSF